MSDQVLVSNEALKEYFTRMEHIFLVVVSHVSCDEFSGSSCCTVTLLLTFSSKNVSCNRSSLVYICALLFVFFTFWVIFLCVSLSSALWSNDSFSTTKNNDKDEGDREDSTWYQSWWSVFILIYRDSWNVLLIFFCQFVTDAWKCALHLWLSCW